MMKVACVALGAVLLLSACASNGSSRFTIVEADGKTLIVQTQESEKMEAIIAGTIAVDGSGCFSLAGEDVANLTPIVWPDGTRLTDDGSGVILDDGTTLGVGDALTAGGGIASKVDTLGSLADRCAGSDVAIIHSVEKGEK